MNRIQTFLSLAALCWLPVSGHAALVEIASGTALIGEGGYGSAVIDLRVDGFAHFGSSNTFVSFTSTFSAVTPVAISTFTVDFGVGYTANVLNLTAAAFDDVTRLSYFASNQAPSTVQGFTYNGGGALISSMTFAAGQNFMRAAVIDSANHIGYFGTHTSPSIIVKVQLPNDDDITTITTISSMTLPSGLDFLSAAVIDTADGFAYFGSSTTTGAIAKIDLSDFSLAGTLTFDSGEGGVASAVIDPAAGFAYFGTYNSPGKIIKVRLGSLTRVGAKTAPVGDNELTSAVIDPAISLAVFGTNTSPATLVPIRLVDFSEAATYTLATGIDFFRSAVVDTTNHYAYFGTYTTPGIVVKVDLLAGPPEVFVNPADAIVRPGEVVNWAILAQGRDITYQWQRNGIDITGETAATYSFTAVAADDGAVYRCIVTNANGSTASAGATVTIIPIVKVYPNPWRADRHSGTVLTFDGLLPNATVKIFNLAAHWVKTLPAGTNTWDLTNDAGQTVASGYYFFLSTTGNENQKSRGKIAIIR